MCGNGRTAHMGVAGASGKKNFVKNTDDSLIYWVYWRVPMPLLTQLPALGFVYAVPEWTEV